jgi:hypothetical protein
MLVYMLLVPVHYVFLYLVCLAFYILKIHREYLRIVGLRRLELLGCFAAGFYGSFFYLV